jgi:tetratricopeptide (TPR) repeat protein
MEKSIKQWCQQHYKIYVPINDQTVLTNIHNLLINNIIYKPTTDIEYLYYARYYGRHLKNKEKQIDCLKKASLSDDKIIKGHALLGLALKYIVTKKQKSTKLFEEVVQLFEKIDNIHDQDNSTYLKCVALNYITLCYMYGDTVKRDGKKAIELAEQVVQLVDTYGSLIELKRLKYDAMINLAKIYGGIRNSGIDPNVDKSIQLYELVINDSTNQKCTALLGLAKLYRSDVWSHPHKEAGEPKKCTLLLKADPLKAIQCYEKIVEIGTNRQKCIALHYLTRFYQNGFNGRCCHRPVAKIEEELKKLDKARRMRRNLVKNKLEKAKACKNCPTINIKKAIQCTEQIIKIGTDKQKESAIIKIGRLYKLDGRAEDDICTLLEDMHMKMVEECTIVI